jgi:nicotinic acid phosphoribosyltransferase
MEADKIAELIKKENAKLAEASGYDINKILSDAEQEIFEKYKFSEEEIRQIRGARPKEPGLNQNMYDFMKDHKLKVTLKAVAEGNNDLLKWCIHEAYIAGFIAGKTKGD